MTQTLRKRLFLSFIACGVINHLYAEDDPSEYDKCLSGGTDEATYASLWLT